MTEYHSPKEQPLGRQTTPEEVLQAAQQFVWAYKNLRRDDYAKAAFHKLQRVMEAVYWPSDSAKDENNEEAADEIERLTRHYDLQRTAFKALEAERDRYRAALERVRLYAESMSAGGTHWDGCDKTHGYCHIAKIAREALAGAAVEVKP